MPAKIYTILLGGTLDTVEIEGRSFVGGGRFLFKGTKAEFNANKEVLTNARTSLEGARVLYPKDLNEIDVGRYFLSYNNGSIDKILKDCASIIDYGTAEGRYALKNS